MRRFVRITRWAIRSAACAMLAAAGCDGEWSPLTRGKSVPEAKPLPLAETVEQLRKWHAEGAYGLMRPYIDPASREDLIDLLVVVDELLVANQAALRAVRTSSPGIPTDRYDLSLLAENLDLFSRSMDNLAYREEGGRGIVTAKIGNRLPLAELTFRHQGGFWLYCPGEGVPGMVDVLREVSRSLDQITLVASASSQTPEEISREYELRVLRKLRRIDDLVQQAAALKIAPDPEPPATGPDPA